MAARCPTFVGQILGAALALLFVMKIAVITNLYWPDEIGGYEILCRQVCEDLVKQGHQVVVLTSKTDAHGPEALSGARIERTLALTEPFDRPATRRSRRSLIAHSRNVRKTATFLRREQPDVVFFWSMRRLTLGPVVATQRMGVPHLFTLNDAWPLTFAPRPFKWEARALASCILDRSIWRDRTTLALEPCEAVAISENLRTSLAGVSPFDDPTVLYQGVPVDRFAVERRPATDSTLRLLYVGQLHEYKGPHVAVEAIGELKRRRPDVRVRLTIAGQGDEAYERRLRARAAELGIEARWSGRVPFAQMPSVYAEHDVLLFTSLWAEPFGLTHIEAMASGLSVVATPTGGTAELLGDGGSALSVPPGDVSALAHAIETLHDDRGMCERLAEAGRELVRERYSLSRYVSNLEGLLRNICRHEAAEVMGESTR